MATYTITSPNGKTLKITGENPPTEAELDEIFAEVDKPDKKGGLGSFVSDIGTGLAQGVSSLGVGLGKNLVNEKLRPMLGKEPLTEEELNKAYGFLDDKPQSTTQKISKGVGEFAPYMLLPEAAPLRGAGLLAKTGNAAITGGYQGAVTGAAESLKNQGDLSGIGSGAGIGAGANIGIPLAFKGAGKFLQVLPQTGGFFAKALGRISPETLEQAVKPNSRALDLTKDEAQQILLDTTQGVRADYADLLKRKGDAVGELLNKLPDEVQFKASDIAKDVDNIVDAYSLSGNPNLNPVRNAGYRELNTIDNLIYGTPADRINKFNTEIDNLAFPQTNKDVIRGGSNGHFWTQDASPMNNALIQADRDFNTYILNNIKNKVAENPAILNDANYLSSLENTLGKVLRNVPLEAQSPYYERLYNAIGRSDILERANTTVSPKELYDINKNISNNLVNWDKGNSATNNALEQIYGANADRISSLNPALREANEEYAKLMQFQKNDAINQILRGDLLDSGKIGAAPTALKNYRGNVTTGNKTKNIQDLEEILYKEGYPAFTDKIDDVNAAMDLLNARTTGDSWLANIATQSTRPVLKTIRKLNQLGIPQAIQKATDKAKSLQRILPPAAVMSTSPMLYGNVEYNDYRD